MKSSGQKSEKRPQKKGFTTCYTKFWSKISEKAKGKRILHLLDTDSIDPTEAVSTEAVAGLPPPFDVVDDDGE